MSLVKLTLDCARGALLVAAPLLSSACLADEAPDSQLTDAQHVDAEDDDTEPSDGPSHSSVRPTGTGPGAPALSGPNPGVSGGPSDDPSNPNVTPNPLPNTSSPALPGTPGGPRPVNPPGPVDPGMGGASAMPEGSAGEGVAGAGAAMTAGGAGNVDPGPMRGPTPATASANFPFPQNRQSPRCTYPTNYDNADVIAAFEKWRADTVTADGASGHLRVKRPMEPGLEVNSTVSEGIAYGMMIAVYMNEQELFDELWKYSQLWLDDRGLMNWYINAAGSQVLGGGAASDADEDMAWALVMADRQWGGSGSLGDTYLNVARSQIDRVWQHEVLEGKLLKAGDTWGDWSSVNVSYFAPSYYRTFAEVSGNAGWNDVVVTSYDTMENTLNDANGNTQNGLVPAWATSEGVPNSGVWGGSDAPTHYQYDSCRTPFRIGLDYCFHDEPRALAYVQKTTSFFGGIGVAGMVDGYDLNGTPRPQLSGGQSASFIGPAGVGAMGPPNQTFVDDAYRALAGLDLLVGGTYYDESWMVLSLLFMTGNFLDYTQYEPLLQ